MVIEKFIDMRHIEYLERIAIAMESIAANLETSVTPDKPKRYSTKLRQELLKLGTLKSLALTLDVTPSTVCQWYKRGIPANQAMKLEIRLDKPGLANHLLKVCNREYL